MNSQSHSYDSVSSVIILMYSLKKAVHPNVIFKFIKNKREVSNVDATLNEVIANLEQGLNTRFDMKITEEMEKLKKFYQ